jgi:hypothetical protein
VEGDNVLRLGQQILIQPLDPPGYADRADIPFAP